MKLLVCLFTFLVSTITFAGDKGNGGGGIKCGHKVELFDFFEGRHPNIHFMQLWNLNPKLSVEDYLNKALKRAYSVDKYFAQYLDAEIKKFNIIPYDILVRPVDIPIIRDADVPFLPKRCTYVQVANWNDRIGRVVFSKKHYEAMDNMNKAGLIIHEVLYKIARSMLGHKDSDQIRLLVAKLFTYDSFHHFHRYDGSFFPFIHKLAYVPLTGNCTLTIDAGSDEKFESLSVTFEIARSRFSPSSDWSHIFIEDGALHPLPRAVIPCSRIKETGLRSNVVITGKKGSEFYIRYLVNDREIHSLEMKLTENHDQITLKDFLFDRELIFVDPDWELK